MRREAIGFGAGFLGWVVMDPVLEKLGITMSAWIFLVHPPDY